MTHTPINDTDEIVCFDKEDEWVQRWPEGIASAPAINESFRVLEDEWNDDYSVRTIIRWEAVPATAKETA